MSATLLHPAKAVAWNEVPFGRYTHVVPGNIVLDMGSCPPLEGEIWNPQFAAMYQVTLVLVILSCCWFSIRKSPVKISMIHASSHHGYPGIIFGHHWRSQIINS